MESNIHKFHKLSIDKRRDIIQRFAGLDPNEMSILKNIAAMDLQTADMMIENVIGTIQLPVGVATNFHINGRDYLIPMAIEEPSVIAAASHAAKLARPAGGFTAIGDESIMVGQIQLIKTTIPFEKIQRSIIKKFDEIKKIANNKDSILIKRGGGVKDISVKEITSTRGPMVVVEVAVDVQDAMGANCVNTMCESIAPCLEKITGGKTRLKIISNLATRRLVRAWVVWKKEVIGEEIIEGVLDAAAFAEADPYRCATHNKGIMNGIDAVIIAAGNDFRAVEAGAHSYASLNGYKPLTTYTKDVNGDLVGKIELPLAAGLVGGATKTNPVAGVSLKILGVKTARELAEIAACVGLANNFAALRAMIKEGIQKGHMKLHAQNIAITAGARENNIDIIVKKMFEEKNITVARAKELLENLK